MSTPASVRNHPIHPMLVPLPIGLWVFSFVCQVAARFSADPATWLTVGLYAAGGGVIGALLAAIPGFVDLLSFKDKHIRSYGIRHMIANLAAVVIWAVVFYLLMPKQAGYIPGLALSVVGIVIISYSGWLGGDMVYEHGVAVKTGVTPPETRKETGHHTAT